MARVRRFQAQFESGELDLAAALGHLHLVTQRMLSGAYCSGQRAHDGLPNNFHTTLRFEQWLQDSACAADPANGATFHPAQYTNPFDGLLAPLDNGGPAPTDNQTMTGDRPGQRSLADNHKEPHSTAPQGNDTEPISKITADEPARTEKNVTITRIFPTAELTATGNKAQDIFDAAYNSGIADPPISRVQDKNQDFNIGIPKCRKRPAAEACNQAAPASKRSRLLNSVKSRFSWISSPSAAFTAREHETMGTPSRAGTVRTKSSQVRRSITGIADLFGQLSVSRRSSVASSIHLRKLKILFVGPGFTGKTTLINTLVTGKYEPATKSSDISVSTIRLPISGEVISLEIWDVPGELTGTDVATLKGTNFHAATVCFSVEAETNLTAVYSWKNLIDHWLIDCPFFVLGTKSDTRPSSAPHLPQLSFAPAAAPAKFDVAHSNARFLGTKYYECTATVHESVFGAVDQIITTTIKSHEVWETERSKDGRKRVGAWCFH